MPNPEPTKRARLSSLLAQYDAACVTANDAFTEKLRLEVAIQSLMESD